MRAGSSGIDLSSPSLNDIVVEGRTMRAPGSESFGLHFKGPDCHLINFRPLLWVKGGKNHPDIEPGEHTGGSTERQIR